MTMNQLNSTIPNLTSAEATAGLTSYRLLAMSTQSAISDFQVFGVDGYNLLKVPSMPAQGLFLTVNASSASAASPLVSLFASRFATVFTLVSSGLRDVRLLRASQLRRRRRPRALQAGARPR